MGRSVGSGLLPEALYQPRRKGVQSPRVRSTSQHTVPSPNDLVRLSWLDGVRIALVNDADMLDNLEDWGAWEDEEMSHLSRSSEKSCSKKRHLHKR